MDRETKEILEFNGIAFDIPTIDAYAVKVFADGKCVGTLVGCIDPDPDVKQSIGLWRLDQPYRGTARAGKSSVCSLRFLAKRFHKKLMKEIGL